jgi:hypothetical protein
VIQCATIHTSCWRKWTFLCIMFWLLTIVTCDWSSAMYETSYGLSSSSVAYAITCRHVILWCLIILHGIVLGLCRVVLWLHVVVGLLVSVVWGWGLVELGHCLPSHHFGMYSICIRCSFLHQLHSYAIFVVVAHLLTKGAI